MLKATIDLGTNTCLLLIAEVDQSMAAEIDNKAIKKIIGDYSTIVRLGKGVDRARTLQPAPMERVLNCLKDYSEKLRNAGLSPDQCICVATSQARDAANSQEFFSRVKKEAGFSFLTLTGDQEAELTFLGALLPEMDRSQTAVIDIGGGSTEITTEHDGTSIDIGSVRLTERYLSTSYEADGFEVKYALCEGAILKALLPVLEIKKTWKKKGFELVGVAGTVTTLAAWQLNLPQFDRDLLDGSSLSGSQILSMIEKLKAMTFEARAQVSAIGPMRADVILPGAMILWHAMDLLGFEKCRVSTRGLRFGVMLNPPA